METTNLSADDSWSSLAQELGLEMGSSPQPEPEPVEAESPRISELPDAFEVGDDTTIEPGLSSEPVSEGGEEEEDDGKRRRRRRRRRRKGAPADGAAEGENESVATEEEHAVVESSADAAMRDVVANWNVPSWDDLIAGLYRPGH